MISTLRTLVPYLIRYRWRFAAGTCALLATSVFTVAIPVVIKFSIDSLNTDFESGTFVQWVGVLLALALVKVISHYWMRWTLIRVSRDIEFDLRRDLFSSLLSFSQQFYRSYRTGDLMSRATNDIAAVRLLLGPGIMCSAEFLVVFCGVLVVMSLTDWRLTCLVLVPVPAISLIVGFFGERIHDRFQRVKESDADASYVIKDHVSNVRRGSDVSGQHTIGESFRAQPDSFTDENFDRIGFKGRFYLLLEALIGLSYLIVLWYGGQRVLDDSMSLGSFVMFMSYITVFMWPLSDFGWGVNLVQRGAVSLARLNEILRQRPDVLDPAGGSGQFVEIRGDLEFQDVTFTYPGSSRPAVENIQLQIQAGETVAILGPTGSGKTTLAQLVARLFDPQKGRVLVDGKDARELPLRSLRQGVGFVPQDTFLFSRTVRDNIAFGVSGEQDWKIAQAAEVAQLTSDVDSLPDRYETLLGEKGVNLSDGQKQKVSIARALLANPRIFILDDTTSSIDPEAAERILRNLQVVMRNRTILLFTQLASTARLADRIIVLDQGRIVEEGPPDDLLSDRGCYHALSGDQQHEVKLEPQKSSAPVREPSWEEKNVSVESANTYDMRLIRRLAAYLHPYRFALGFAMALLIVHSLLGVAGPFLTKVAVDRYFQVASLPSLLDPWLLDDGRAGLDLIALLYAATLLVGFVTHYLQTYLMHHTGQRVMRDLRLEIFIHLKKMSTQSFDPDTDGRWLTGVNKDRDSLNKIFTPGAVAVVGDTLTLATISGAMFCLSPKLALVVFTLAPPVLLVPQWFRQHARAAYCAVQQAATQTRTLLQEHISGVKVVQLFVHEDQSMKEFEGINIEHRDAHRQAIRVHACFYPAIECLAALAIGVLLLYGGFRVSEDTLTVGVVVAFLLYVVRIFRTIQDLTEKNEILQSAMASCERIFGMLDTPTHEEAAGKTSGSAS